MTASGADDEADDAVEPPRLELEVGVARALSPMVRRIVAPNPNIMTGPGTNTYLAGIDEVVVVDPGPDDAGHLEAILGCGGDRIRWIVCTHTHPDHSFGAATLAEATGAAVLAYESRDDLDVDDTLADGDSVEATEFRLQAVHTPGHASNHLCLLLTGERLLFTGDHVNQGQTTVINPPDGDMAVYVESLRKIAAIRRLRSIAPGHGHLIEDPQAAIAEYLSHRSERESEVLEALDRTGGESSIDALVTEVYGDTIIDALRPVAARTVYAHLIKLRADQRVEGTDEDHPWVAT